MVKAKSNKYKIKVQIGKRPIAAGLKKRVYRFEADTIEGLAKKLTLISIPKMMEECFFTFEYKDKKTTKTTNAFKARGIFNNELNAFFFIKTQLWVLK